MSLSRRQLVAGDEAVFRALRLSGLKSDPEAFGSTFAAEEAYPLERYERMLANNYIMGVFASDRLAGAAAYYRMTGTSDHRGYVWGVIVDQANRGHGIGQMVLEGLLDHARGSVKQLHLGVGTYNQPAIKLYQRVGFEIYGTEPRSLCVNGRYIDEHMMVRFLDEAPGKTDQ